MLEMAKLAPILKEVRKASAWAVTTGAGVTIGSCIRRYPFTPGCTDRVWSQHWEARNGKTQQSTYNIGRRNALRLPENSHLFMQDLTPIWCARNIGAWISVPWSVVIIQDLTAITCGLTVMAGHVSR